MDPAHISAHRAPTPRSCDTFVFVGGGAHLSDAPRPGGGGDRFVDARPEVSGAPAGTLFFKNSDRPAEEEHEVVSVPASTHPPGSMVQCTYITIPQAEATLAVVLSRPRWLWGCEMGANEMGVVGGNEAVGSALADELGSEPRLLGMDLLRLALERGRTARQAVEVCCALLEAHGQGGGCEELDKSWTYENGFLFADASEAYVMETAGVRHWAVERLGAGAWRNISNGLSIRTQAHGLSKDILRICQERGWWDGVTRFDWKSCVGYGGRFGTSVAALAVSGREAAGARFLAELAQDAAAGKLAPDDVAGWVARAATILRDEDSGICFRELHGFSSTGSQISWLQRAGCSAGEGGGARGSPPSASGAWATHLFTASSDPQVAIYKRFSFPPPPPAEKLTSNFGSLELWREWRQLALRGGAKGQAGETLRRRLAQLEEVMLSELSAGEPPRPDGFVEAIAAERQALKPLLGLE